MFYLSTLIYSFNTQPPEGGCLNPAFLAKTKQEFQHTATRRWLPATRPCKRYLKSVSTHSHPKVAAFSLYAAARVNRCFNTQPPEGGCSSIWSSSSSRWSFNTQPPEGGCLVNTYYKKVRNSFNTQPPEGGCLAVLSVADRMAVSTHSHPKVAAA